MGTAGMTSSRVEPKNPAPLSPAMNGCHRRKRPKCTSSQTRWKALPGSEMSPKCSARSIASTTQRRWAEIERERRWALEIGKAKYLLRRKADMRCRIDTHLRSPKLPAKPRRQPIMAEKQDLILHGMGLALTPAPKENHTGETNEIATIRIHPRRNRDRPRDHRPAARRNPQGAGAHQQRQGEEPRQRLPRDSYLHLRLPGQ